MSQFPLLQDPCCMGLAQSCGLCLLGPYLETMITFSVQACIQESVQERPFLNKNDFSWKGKSPMKKWKPQCGWFCPVGQGQKRVALSPRNTCLCLIEFAQCRLRVRMFWAPCRQGSEVTVDINLHQQQEVTEGGTDYILLVVYGCVFITDTLGFFSPLPISLCLHSTFIGCHLFEFARYFPHR